MNNMLYELFCENNVSLWVGSIAALIFSFDFLKKKMNDKKNNTSLDLRGSLKPIYV